MSNKVYRTKFFYLLLSARSSNEYNFNVILKMMEPLIKKLSHIVDYDKNLDYYDEDLESTLIMEVWKHVNNIDFIMKLSKNMESDE